MPEYRSASGFAGADWLQAAIDARAKRKVGAQKPLGKLGRQVADLLGDVFRGIYHIDRAVLHPRVDWSDEHYIAIVWRGTLDSYDFPLMTHLTVLAHDRCIRVEVEGAAPGYLRICFSSRTREGNCTVRHPTIEQAIESVRKQFPTEEVQERQTAPSVAPVASPE